MSEVALPIGGKTYRVACAAGEEDHVAALGAVINEKLTSMGNLSGHEAQNLLFAALLLADEVHEGRGAAGGSGDVAAAKAMAETAAGERDELKAALANRDEEFEQLQTAHNDAAQECVAARERLTELSERLAERQANEAALLARIEELSADGGQHTAPTAGTSVADSDLAPALESLAEMLEQTADKLERAARTS